MYLLKTKKPQADTQTPPSAQTCPHSPPTPSHGVGAAAYQQFPGGRGGFNGEMPRSDAVSAAHMHSWRIRA